MRYSFSRDYSTGFVKHDSKQTSADFDANLPAFLIETWSVPPPYALLTCRSLWTHMLISDRHYHTPAHILTIFCFANKLHIPLTADQQLAIWFHDVIYDVRAAPGVNESQSAAFLRSHMLKGHPDAAALDLAESAIVATAKHLSADVDPRHADVMDLDLYSFSWDHANYLAAGKAIAKEFIPFIGAEQYDISRRKFLQQLLVKGFIYRGKAFGDRYEQVARQNIERDLL